MIRILHVRSTTGVYGAERALLALAAETTAPYVPTLAAISRGAGAPALLRAAAREGIPAAHFESEGPVDLACAGALGDHACALGARLLHAHDFKALFLSLLASRAAQAPVVATFHGDTGASVKLGVYEAAGRLLANFCPRVAAVSRHLERRLRRWAPRSQVVFIPNGLRLADPPGPQERQEARVALELGEGEAAIAIIARLSPEKGHAVLLEALRSLRRPAPCVLLAGEGPLRETLERSARGLNVRFLGYRDEVRQLYAACDLVVIPSLTEGLPVVALEAGAAGRCVLATAVGELPELLAGAGALVPAADPAALAGGLERLLADAEERGRFASALGARVRQRYGAAAMAAGYTSAVYGPALATAASAA